MWKDWFFYSRGQRRAIIFLLLVLILLICILASENIGNNRTEIAIEPLKIADSLYVRIDNDKRNRDNYRRYKDPVYKKNKKQSSDFSYEHKKEEKKEIKKYPKQEKFNAGIIIDVNTADTSILKKIPGVGSVISRNIVNYRNRLGGFYNTAQLLEVQYVDSTLLKWFEVKSDVFRKIRINKAGIDELRSHPYMDFYKAKAIIDFRRKRGSIDGMSQISMFEEFSEEDIDKLSHYFSFE